MKTMPYVYWQHEVTWIGYLQEFPDYWTQGESRDELEENLKDLWQDFTSGNVSAGPALRLTPIAHWR